MCSVLLIKKNYYIMCIMMSFACNDEPQRSVCPRVHRYVSYTKLFFLHSCWRPGIRGVMFNMTQLRHEWTQTKLLGVECTVLMMLQEEKGRVSQTATMLCLFFFIGKVKQDQHVDITTYHTGIKESQQWPPYANSMLFIQDDMAANVGNNPALNS